jgi:predicted metalloenzyme YecM
MAKRRRLIAVQVRCQNVVNLALRMTDEEWKQVFPVARVLMLEAAQCSLANGRPILVLPVDAEAYQAAAEKLGLPADGRLRGSE